MAHDATLTTIQGYTLSSRIDGWTMVIFVPKTGRGEMRMWHSQQVQQDTPDLPALVRRLIFDQLEPHRQQLLSEQLHADRMREMELHVLQRRASNAETELEMLRAQIRGGSIH